MLTYLFKFYLQTLQASAHAYVTYINTFRVACDLLETDMHDSVFYLYLKKLVEKKFCRS